VDAREFSLEEEYGYNRAGPVRWILSHALRYPGLPVLLFLAAAGNNAAFSYVQVFVGRSFDLITHRDGRRPPCWRRHCRSRPRPPARA